MLPPMSDEQLWGSETAKAVENFKVSGEPVPLPAGPHQGGGRGGGNGELGEIDAGIAEAIAAAADDVAAGSTDDQFPIDVLQTGSGTSSSTNVNEVIANLAGEEAHPRSYHNRGELLKPRFLRGAPGGT